PSLMGAEEVATGTEPEQSTGVGDRTSFTWPVELPSGARLLPIVAAPEPPGEASVNLTENAQATSPVNPIGVTSEPAADLTGEAETTSPVNLTDSTGNPSPVNLTGATSQRRDSKRDLRKRRTRAVRRSTSPVKRNRVEARARALDALIPSGALAETASLNKEGPALRWSPESAGRAIEWRHAHLSGEVGTPPPVTPPAEAGEPVADQTGEATATVLTPHELAVELALPTAR